MNYFNIKKILFLIYIIYLLNFKYAFSCNYFNNFNKIENYFLNNNYKIGKELLYNLEKNNNICNSIKILCKLTNYYYILKKYNISNYISENLIKKNFNVNKSYILYIKAMSNLKIYENSFNNFTISKIDKDISNIEISFNSFNEICNKHKHSIYYNESLKYLCKLKNILVLNKLYIINYYYNKSLHLSVINRSIYIIDNFPELCNNAIKFLKKSKKTIIY